MYQTLIQPVELMAQLHREDWCVIDCRFDLADSEAGRLAYREAHIAGAVYAHLNEDLSAPVVPGQTGRHPLPAPEVAAATFRRLGVRQGAQVVAYDDKGGAIAARAWWMLRWLGHERVAVLDGGWNSWTQMGLSIASGTPSVEPGDFVARPHPEWIADRALVERIRQDSDHALVDSRTAERYRGEYEPIDPIAGHIPGAINLPFPDNLEDRRFRSTNQLNERFAQALGDTPAERTVFYCGSGVTACHNILAHAHAGRGMARLYPGSWSEWINGMC